MARLRAIDLIELVEKKYLKNNLLNVNTVSALRDFFKYFKDKWVHSGENKWYEGSAPHRSDNDQGIEAVNKAIKQSKTFRCKLSISQFFDVSLRMNQEWSCGEDPNRRQLVVGTVPRALYRPSPDVSLVLNDPDLEDPVAEAEYAAPASLSPFSMSPSPVTSSPVSALSPRLSPSRDVYFVSEFLYLPQFFL